MSRNSVTLSRGVRFSLLVLLVAAVSVNLLGCPGGGGGSGGQNYRNASAVRAGALYDK